MSLDRQDAHPLSVRERAENTLQRAIVYAEGGPAFKAIPPKNLEKPHALLEALLIVQSSIGGRLKLEKFLVSAEAFAAAFEDVTEEETQEEMRPYLDALIPLLLTRKETFKSQLAYLLALYPTEEIAAKFPGVVLSHLQGDGKHVSFMLQSHYKKWRLCEMTEVRMALAVLSGHYTLIRNGDEPLFITKAYGKPSALCLKSLVAANGKRFERGCWYAPADQETFWEVRKSIRNHENNLSLEAGTWAYMRKSSTASLNDSMLCNDIVADPQDYGLDVDITEVEAWVRRPKITKIFEAMDRANLGKMFDEYPIVALVEDQLALNGMAEKLSKLTPQSA